MLAVLVSVGFSGLSLHTEAFSVIMFIPFTWHFLVIKKMFDIEGTYIQTVTFYEFQSSQRNAQDID